LTWEVYQEEMLPFWLYVTKGYGITVDDINWMCPADLEPYAKAHMMELKEKDMYIHAVYGNYAISSFITSFDICLNGKKAKTEYIKDLITNQRNAELTEEEKQKEVDLFFAKHKSARMAWNQRHHKDDSAL
jgi:hypothetical protein